tara:strand:- start:13 stop:597 length:585 start_codon:yes stop_codon:yes gene_type:complete
MIKTILTIFFISGVVAQTQPDPATEPEKPDIVINFVKADDELLLNWSVNTYVGYPVYKAENFSRFDDNHFIYGLSLGTPLGLKTGLSYSTLNFELINYIFGNTNPSGNEVGELGATVFHIGLNSGMFINDLSLNFTLATGKHEHGYGYISAINIDLPYWGDFEVRSTIRFTAVPTEFDLTSGWVDLGVSLGYEF